LHYKIQLQPVEARRVAAHADPHGVNWRTLRNLIRAIDRIIPRINFGKNNPNNGRTFHTYFFGKEGSRVLYVELIHAYLKGGDAVVEIGKIELALRALVAQTGAEEFDADHQPGSTTFRIWWD
jgi:hypothetical protein